MLEKAPANQLWGRPKSSNLPKSLQSNVPEHKKNTPESNTLDNLNTELILSVSTEYRTTKSVDAMREDINPPTMPSNNSRSTNDMNNNAPLLLSSDQHIMNDPSGDRVEPSVITTHVTSSVPNLSEMSTSTTPVSQCSATKTVADYSLPPPLKETPPHL